MTKLGKYMYAVNNSIDGAKTERWSINNIKSTARLGVIKWYGPWRQYCFFPTEETVFNHECLFEIQRLMQTLELRRKRGQQKMAM